MIAQYRFCFSLLLCLFCFSFTALAQGDLLITPKRIVFDGSKRVEEINLANIGKDTATYSISFVQYKMDENGRFENISDEDTTVKFAHKNLRFFPRTVTLGPNEAQSVKVQLLKANELSTGEYRSHLYFRAMPTTRALGEEEKQNADSNISVKITPVFGISIPVIIRMGETTVSSSFSNARIVWDKSGEAALDIALNRTGNISSYGDITVNYIAPDNKATQIVYMRGLAVYLPNSKRNLHLPLAKPPGIDYKSGRLQIIFTDQAPRPQLLCQAELSL